MEVAAMDTPFSSSVTFQQDLEALQISPDTRDALRRLPEASRDALRRLLRLAAPPQPFLSDEDRRALTSVYQVLSNPDAWVSFIQRFEELAGQPISKADALFMEWQNSALRLRLARLADTFHLERDEPHLPTPAHRPEDLFWELLAESLVMLLRPITHRPWVLTAELLTPLRARTLSRPMEAYTGQRVQQLVAASKRRRSKAAWDEGIEWLRSSASEERDLQARQGPVEVYTRQRIQQLLEAAKRSMSNAEWDTFRDQLLAIARDER